MMEMAQENWPNLAGSEVHHRSKDQDVNLTMLPPEPEFTFTLSDASSSQEGNSLSPPKNGFGLSQEEGSCSRSPPKAGGASSEKTVFESASPWRKTGSTCAQDGGSLPSPPPKSVIVELPEKTSSGDPTTAVFSQDNQQDGSSSGESETCPVADRHSQETEIPKKTCVVSAEPKDVVRHRDGCNYYMWNEVHRESLLKMDAVKERLYKTTCTIKGNTYGMDHADEIKQEIEENGTIRKYLAGSRNVYESFRGKMTAYCKCSQTGKDNPGTTNANLLSAVDGKMGDNSETVLNSDLKVSDSESDEDMDTTN